MQSMLEEYFYIHFTPGITNYSYSGLETCFIKVSNEPGTGCRGRYDFHRRKIGCSGAIEKTSNEQCPLEGKIISQ